jgi:hypothetical protein
MRYNSWQLTFALFVQGLGDSTSEDGEKGSKTLPRTAEKGMRLRGTGAGERLFPGQTYMSRNGGGEVIYARRGTGLPRMRRTPLCT